MLRKILPVLSLIVLAVYLLPISSTARTSFDVPDDSSFKTYMDYRIITSPHSTQYQIQKQSTTDAQGLRQYYGRYCVAIGTGFGAEVGDQIDVVLDETTIHCVVGDIKKDIHTDSANMQVAHNGNVVEFIVDTSVLDDYVASSGDISNVPGFSGDVNKLVVYDNYDYPDNTVVAKSELTEGCYIIEYVRDCEVLTVFVDFDTYNSMVPFVSVYEE